MAHVFDPGYGVQPFRTLCEQYPESDVYPQDEFRVEWGPIFHRGRLDGSARVLVIGQDPAQHETIIRRVLVGEAGRRVQGFLAKLGIDKSYVIINTYLYSVFGSVSSATRKGAGLVGYRNKWFAALVASGKVEGVVAFGTAANEAWDLFKATPEGQAINVAFAPVTHPTFPESSSGGDKTKLANATKSMLTKWNGGLDILRPAITHPDGPIPTTKYGSAFADGDRLPIPERDMPAGLPPWMHENDGWARRSGTDTLAKRRNITLTVPLAEVPSD